MAQSRWLHAFVPYLQRLVIEMYRSHAQKAKASNLKPAYWFHVLLENELRTVPALMAIPNIETDIILQETTTHAKTDFRNGRKYARCSL